MASQWYFQVMGEQIGPVSSEELRNLAERGTVTPDTPIRKAPDGVWVPAERVRGLFPIIGERGQMPNAVIVGNPPKVQPAGQYDKTVRDWLAFLAGNPPKVQPYAEYQPTIPNVDKMPPDSPSTEACSIGGSDNVDRASADARFEAMRRQVLAAAAERNRNRSDLPDQEQIPLRSQNSQHNTAQLSPVSDSQTGPCSTSRVSCEMICCYACKKDIADNAATCPRCGAIQTPEGREKGRQLKKQQQILVGICITIFAAPFLIFLLFGLFAGPSNSSLPPGPASWDTDKLQRDVKEVVDHPSKTILVPFDGGQPRVVPNPYPTDSAPP